MTNYDRPAGRTVTRSAADPVEFGEIVAGELESRAGHVLPQVRHRRGAGDQQMFGDRCSSQASATAIGDASNRAATAVRAEDCSGLKPLGSGAGCDGEPRPMRYSELARLLAGVSQKMLTQTLRSLERDGLITRTATPTVPVTVTYELTELGFSLHEMMRGLKLWAQLHMDDVFASRVTYDTSRS
jgi:DNA-binding HxlR family transcriptional regulator